MYMCIELTIVSQAKLTQFRDSPDDTPPKGMFSNKDLWALNSLLVYKFSMHILVISWRTMVCDCIHWLTYHLLVCIDK